MAIDCSEFSRVEECIPVGEIDLLLFHLWAGILEFFEESAGAEIMVIGVDLAQNITDLDVRLEIIRPVLFAAIHRNPAIWTLKVDVGGRYPAGLWLSSFRVIRIEGDACLSM